MTYPEKLEKVVAKKYAFPALLYGAAMILSVIELFVNFGLSQYYLYTSRVVLLAVCVAFLLVFVLIRKNVNFYDVTATALLAIVIIADLFCLLSSCALYTVPRRLSTVIDVYPGGLIKYYQVFTSANGAVQSFSEHMYAFSFLGLFEGVFLIFIAVCTVKERKRPEKAEAIDKVNRRIMTALLIAATVAAVTFILVNFLYAAPRKFDEYSPLFVSTLF